MIRQKDIAQQAGVSVVTVSKALRDKPDISISTKARIRGLADQLGYTPNLGARGLRTRKTNLLGLVIPATTDPIFARIVMAIEQQAFESGYELVMAHSLNQPEREAQILRSMIDRRVDGIFLSPVYRLEPEAPIYDELSRRRIPTVILGPLAPFCKSYPHVQTQGSEAAQLMTRHLLELGHQRIAFFAGPQMSTRVALRLEGYQRALRDFGIASDPGLVFNAGTTIAEGEKAALQLIEESPDVTAVQAVNDLVAIGAVNVFLAQGVAIPDDLSVAGFGNILTSEHCRVPMTTVRQPKFRLGMAAFELLQGLLSGESRESSHLPAELVIRDSTGPPKAPKS